MKKLSPRRIHLFMVFKLPAAYFTGVRVASIGTTSCVVRLKHRWINQNPFRSLFWAVQGMAAELSTGVLVMQAIQDSGKNIAMLVASNRGDYHKKATGKILFECADGDLIREAVQRTIASGEGQKCPMRSIGRNEAGDIVSEFMFEWTIKVRK